MKQIVYILLLMGVLGFNNSGAVVITSVPDVTSCPNKLVIIPVIIENGTNISSITLHLNYNILNGVAVPGVLSYVGFQNAHPVLNNALIVNNSGNTVVMSWYQTYLINLPHDTLVELRFYYSGGTTDLNWVTGGVSKYWSYSCGTLPASFLNGSVDLTGPSPSILLHPNDSTVYSGEECSFLVSASNATSYNWKLSKTGGITWVNLADTGVYIGSSTNELLITEAKIYMNNYYYRCYVTGACSPYQYSNPALLSVIPVVKVKVDSICSCPGEMKIPVTVKDFYGVAEFSIQMNYDSTILYYDTCVNPHLVLSSGILDISVGSGNISISWNSATSQNIMDDTLLEFRFFSLLNDTSNILSWNTSVPGLCYFKDLNNNEIVSSYTNGRVDIVMCSDINGKVHYDNQFAQELAGVTLYLTKDGFYSDSTVTDSSGNYTFGQIHNDTYILSASMNGIWDGVNSADALMIMRHFVGLDTITGLRLLAADIDKTGFINAADALGVQQRFVGLINTFPSGDMVFQTDTIILNDTTTLNLDLVGLFTGDVNASYVPWTLPLIISNRLHPRPGNQ